MSLHASNRPSYQTAAHVPFDNFARNFINSQFSEKFEALEKKMILGYEEEAITDLDNLLTTKGLQMSHLVKIASVYYKIGDSVKCLEIVNGLKPIEEKLLIESEPLPIHLEYLNLEGMALKDSKKHEQARSQWMRCLELDPRFSPALNNIGNYHMHNAEYDLAAKYYHKAIQSNCVLTCSFY
jgi:tetratricopeptide (TPR) repeat protein